jgi:hypothetical protein
MLIVIENTSHGCGCSYDLFCPNGVFSWIRAKRHPQVVACSCLPQSLDVPTGRRVQPHTRSASQAPIKRDAEVRGWHCEPATSSSRTCEVEGGAPYNGELRTQCWLNAGPCQIDEGDLGMICDRAR